jgi:hypothetical protein
MNIFRLNIVNIRKPAKSSGFYLEVVGFYLVKHLFPQLFPYAIYTEEDWRHDEYKEAHNYAK